MERRTQVIIGAIGSVLAIIFIALLVRSCGRQSSSTEITSEGGVVTVSGDEGTSPNLQACTPDPKTGLCYPRPGNVIQEDFNMKSFVANVEDLRSSSSSSSSSDDGGSIFDGILGGSDESSSDSENTLPGDFADDETSSDASTSVRSSSSRSLSSSSRTSSRSVSSGISASSGTSSSLQAPGFDREYSGSDTVTVEIIGGGNGSQGSTSSSRFGSRSSSSRSPSFFNRSSTSRSSSSRSSSSRSSSSRSGVSTTVQIVDNGNGGSGSGGSGGSGGGSGGGSVNRTHCDPRRSLLNVIDFGDLTTGTTGWTFPVLLNGDCPITAAMIRVDKSGGFGGPLDDF